jgi:serine/threonine-protein kinase TTK/MPS1
MGLLGRGGSSKVFRVCDKDHIVYALKKIDLGRGADAETYQAFLNEISLLEALRGHDRIIQLVAHEVNEAKRSLIMVMEIGEIDLNALLQERIAKGAPASMNFVRYMWEQMLEAVNVIHDEGIVHTDLKPANFVLVKGALKLIDFGIAKAIPNDTTNIARDQQIGTANYMSPEALNPHNSAKNGRVMKVSSFLFS